MHCLMEWSFGYHGLKPGKKEEEERNSKLTSERNCYTLQPFHGAGNLKAQPLINTGLQTLFNVYISSNRRGLMNNSQAGDRGQIVLIWYLIITAMLVTRNTNTLFLKVNS